MSSVCAIGRQADKSDIFRQGALLPGLSRSYIMESLLQSQVQIWDGSMDSAGDCHKGQAGLSSIPGYGWTLLTFDTVGQEKAKQKNFGHRPTRHSLY